jgi:hypothetical protein
LEDREDEMSEYNNAYYDHLRDIDKFDEERARAMNAQGKRTGILRDKEPHVFFSRRQPVKINWLPVIPAVIVAVAVIAWILTNTKGILP